MTSQDKKIGPFLAIMVVASCMIGSGIFLLPASLGAIGSISILAWVVATLGALVIGAVFSWLAILNPGAKDLFSYIRDALGPAAGFVSGVLYWASCLVACVAVALAVTGYLSFFVPVLKSQQGTAIATALVLWVLIAGNLFGPRFVAKFLSVTLVLGLAPVLLAATFGWLFFHAATFSASWNVTGGSFLSVVPRATVMVFWAFLGIEGAIVIARRVKNPARDVPIGTLGGLVLAATIYMAASAAIMGMLPASALAKSTAPFADAIAPALGALAAGVVALCAMIKAAGTLSGTILMTAESADSDAVLGQMRTRAPVMEQPRAPLTNYVVTGVLTNLIVLASVSPTLARQFSIVTNVSVVLSVLVYGAASLALLRMSVALSAGRRFWAGLSGGAGLVFSVLLIAASERDLLVWSACAMGLGLAGYQAVRMRRPTAAKVA